MPFRPQTQCLTLSAATLLMLSACASTSSSTLLNGIDSDALTASSSATTPVTRTASDPVCEQFYRNAIEYAEGARRPNPGGQILAATGLSVVAAVASSTLFRGIDSRTGRVAAQAATSQLIYTGGGAAISGLNSADKIDARIIDAADDIGCPVQTTP